MRDLTVTLVQANQIWENVPANLSHFESLLSSIDSTDLIVLPEMFQTAFSMKTTLAEKMTGPSVSWLKKIASEKNCAVYTSLMISENDAYYNRGLFVKPDGSLSIYDKRKSFGLAKENEHFTAGKEEQIVSWRGWKIQLQICYDLRFPEIVRNRMLDDGTAAYDLLLYVANWPEKRSSHWNALLKARAIENQCFVIGVNRVGKDANDFTYSGDSKVIDALGVESNVPTGVESCTNHVIKTEDLKNIRELLPFLSDRS